MTTRYRLPSQLPDEATAAVTGDYLVIQKAGESKLRRLNPSVLTPAAFPSGTVMLFVQTAAPTGWTKVTTHNDKALRVVSGTVSTGGTSAFSTAFAARTSAGTVATNQATTATGSTGNTTATNAGVEQETKNTSSVTATNNATTAAGTVGNTTLTTDQIPSHGHDVSGQLVRNLAPSTSGNMGVYGTGTLYLQTNGGQPSDTGGGLSHTHTFTGTSHNHTQAFHEHSFTITSHNHTQAAHNHTFTGVSHNHTQDSHTHTLDLAVQYVDVIIATKD
jgi:hypothetical protein